MNRPEDINLIFRLIKAAASEIGITGAQKQVLISFVDQLRPEENGQLAWPSAETIALQWDTSERNVRRAISQLCELDYMKLQQRTGRHNIYSVNVGLIARAIKTGRSVRSLREERTSRPVRPDTMSGQGGSGVRSDRTPRHAKNPRRTQEEPNEELISPVGSSQSVGVGDDPMQRKLLLHSVVGAATDRMRMNRAEEPKEEKREKGSEAHVPHVRSQIS